MGWQDDPVVGPGDFAQRIVTRGERSADNAVSPKGAYSAHQVMPATAANPGFGVAPAAPGDLADANRMGDEYANAMKQKYGGDEVLAAAAYNAGPTTVDDWLNGTNHSGKNPQGLKLDRANFATTIPFPETRNYVARVTGASAAPAPAAQSWQNDPVVQPQATQQPQAQTPAPTPQPVKPAAPAYQGPLNDLGIGVQGVGSGLANVAGLPVDLTTMLLNTGAKGVNYVADKFGAHDPIPQISNPIGGSQNIKNAASSAAESVGYPVFDKSKMTDSQKLGFNVNDYGTQAVTAGGAGLAASGARAAEIATGKAAPAIGDAFLHPYIQNGSKALIGDLASGVGAGTGHTVAEKYAPNSPLADFMATLIGGVGGATSIASAATAKNVANWAGKFGTDANIPLDAATGAATKNGISDHAAQMMQGSAVNPELAAKNVRSNAAELQSNSLPLPPLGLLSEDVGLRGAEAGMRANGGKNAPFIQADDKLKDASTGLVNSLRDPAANQDAVPGAALTYKSAQLDPLNEAVNTSENLLSTLKSRDITDAIDLPPMRTSEARATASQNLDEALLQGKVKPARDAKNAAFDQARAQAGDELVDAQPVVDSVNKIKENLTPFLKPGAVLPQGVSSEFVSKIQQISDAVDAAGPGARGLVKAGDLADVRPYLATASKGARMSGNFQLAENIDTLRKSVNAAIEAAPPFKAANDVYKNEFVPVARTGGPVEKLVRNVERDPSRMQTPPSQTAATLLNTPEGAADLKGVLDHQPPSKVPQITGPTADTTNALTVPEGGGKKAVRDYLLSKFADSSLNADGTIRPERAQRWSEQNAAVLQSYPEVAKEISGYVTKAKTGAAQTAEATDILNKARGDYTARQSEIETSAAGALLKDDPRKVAERFLNDRYGGADKMAEVNALVKNDSVAKRGWKAAVAEVLADKTSGLNESTKGTADSGATYRVETAKLDRMFKANEDKLSQVFDPSEMNTLRRAQKLMGYLKSASVRATAGSDTAEKTSAMTDNIERLIRLKYGALEGGAIMRKIKLMLKVLPNSDAAVADLVHRAWFDPEIGAYLLSKKIAPKASLPSNPYVRKAMSLGAAARDGDSNAPNQ